MSLVRNSATIVSYTLTEGNSSLIMNAAQALDALHNFDAIANQIAADNQTTPTPTPVVSGFEGIFNFSGPASIQLEQLPFVAGTYLGFTWAQLEPVQGQFQWNIIDAALAPWVNKKVILRVSASGWKKWWTPPLAQWTPQWVYDSGVQHIMDDDGSVKPEYWNQKFLLALQNFITAFGQRYDGHPNILGIEMGIGDGGETKVDTSKGTDVLSKWKSIGYTDDLWFSAIKEIILMYKSAFATTPRILMPDASFIGGSKTLSMSSVLDYAVSEGCWLQDNGVIKGEVLKSTDWSKVPVISEQRQETSQSGDTLDWDLNQMINVEKCKAALIFTSDLANPKNVATLQKYAALAGK